MKKSGFTMIELIFVIVILGVLAAVAIPKLNATRDDAEQAKAMTNLATLMGDLTSYYTAQGSFQADVTKMTNVPLEKKTDTNEYDYKIKNTTCLTFQTVGASLVVTPATSNVNPVCEKILKNTSTQNIIRGTHTCKIAFKKTASGNTFTQEASPSEEDTGIPEDVKKACKIAAGGTLGKPATAEAGVIYHNVVTTQLGKKLKNDDGSLENAASISEYKPVVMSFEGAGVAF